MPRNDNKNLITEKDKSTIGEYNMRRKLLAALVSALLVSVTAQAEPSALENALNDPNTEKFIMPGDQSISADLPMQNQRYLEINDGETATGEHYFNITGNGHSGFSNTNSGAYDINYVNTISGFNTKASASNPNGDGGAFFLDDDACLTVVSSIYDADKNPLMTTIANNTAAGKGGAIYANYNWGGAVYLSNTNIVDNIAGAEGGGIYLDWGISKIVSLPGTNVVIADNKAVIGGKVVDNDIYLHSGRSQSSGGLRGTLDLMTRSTANDPSSSVPTGAARIYVGDLRAEGSSDIEIMSSKNDTAIGQVMIDNLVLDNDAMFSTEYVAPNSKTGIYIPELTMSRDSIINTVNGYIDDNLHIIDITLDNSNNKFMVDASLMNGNEVIDSFGTITGGTGKLVVNIIGSDTESGIVRISSAMGNATFADSTTQYGGLKYTFTQDPNDKGIFYYTTSKDRSVTLQDALADYTLPDYDMPDLTVLTSDLGELVLENEGEQPITREFTLNGNDGYLISEEHMGIVVNGSQENFGTKLNVNSIETASGFANKTEEDSTHAKGSFISASEADVTLEGSTFTENTAQAAGATSSAQGGAIYVGNAIDDTNLHTTTISKSTFESNSAVSDKYTASGGAVYSKFNQLNIEGTIFDENIVNAKSSAMGGAVYFENPYPSELEGVTLNISNTAFRGNSAVSKGSSTAAGGALAIVGNEGPSIAVNLEDVLFKDNNVTTGSMSLDRYALGAAIYNENGRITLKNVQFVNNTATSSNTGETVYSDITNRGINGSVTFLGGDTTLQGGIVNKKGFMAEGGHVIVEEGANLRFAETSKLQQGSLIVNNGTVTVNSTDENNSLDRLSVAEGSSLTLNSPLLVSCTDNAGETVNNGTITNNSDNFVLGSGFVTGERVFTNNSTINGEGSINVKYGTLENNGTIENNVELSGSNTVLNSSYEGVTGNVTLTSSGARYNVEGDSTTFDDANRIQGTKGKLYLNGEVTSDVALAYTGDVYLNNGARVTLGAGDAFQSASGFYVGDVAGGETSVTATLNTLNGRVDALNYGGALSIDGDSILNLEFDWGDSFAADAPFLGKAVISKVDLSNVDNATYNFASPYLKDNILLGAVDLITAEGKANTVSYSYDNSMTGWGTLTASRDTLANVIRTSEITGDEDAYYNYSMDANEAGNSARNVVGNLQVQGNGNAIETTGITVGDTANGLTADVVLKDTNISGVTTMADETGAITIEEGSRVEIRAENHDVTLSGTTGANKNAIYLDTAGGISSSVAFEAENGHTITIDDDIRSDSDNNMVFFNKGTIIANGVIDPITAVNTGADVTRGGVDEDVTWQLFSGSLNYLSDSYLNNPSHLNSIEFRGGTLNLVNGAATDIALKNIVVNGNSDLYLDADLAAGTMDRFSSTTSSYLSGALNVAGINLLSDGNSDITTINFTTDSNLMGNVNYTGGQGLTAMSPIYKYDVGYDNKNGNFNFQRSSTGTSDDYNPAVFAPSVAAQLGGYFTQLQSYDEAFYNMDMYMLMSSEERQALKFKNKVASADGQVLYDETLMRQERAEGWVRPYATFERVGLKHGPKVSNVMYGSFFGADSKMYDLGHGWDGMWGAYVGYNGSHQAYKGNSIYQNGGTLGLSGMAFKGNFFTGLTINSSASGAEASTMYGHENFAMLMAGIASKTGYNWELARGKFIIQPSLLMSYSFVNTFDYTNAAGVRMNSDPLHAIQIQPELKFIGNLKNGWQPYAGISLVCNILDDTKFKANDVSLPDLSVKPFIRYGAGIRKTWGERFTGFLQTYFTNVGRNGVGIQAGFSWLLGKNK